jgi:Gluconate 2-dehydrogenase subunit 3
MANTTNPPPAKLTRRQLVERLLAAAAAGAVWPAIAAAHPIHQHLMNGELLDRADSLSEAADWTPLFLSTEQNAALLPLAESLLPGSTSAEVNRFIDLLLGVESPENQRKFSASLAALEKTANDRFTRGLATLAHTEYEILLTTVSGPDAPQREHFDHLKEWITGAYYSSETGMRELGWTGNFAFPGYPQCETPRSAT